MIEFGSDFHYIKPEQGAGKTLYDFYPRANLYADGRQALIHLYQSQGWERLWMPNYFCYEVVESLKQAGLEIFFYADNPGYSGDSQTLENIQKHGHFKPTDAILRVNYFGTRSYRSPENLPVAAVIEDHTHDLIGGWATNSHADWCIASLRKTLPIPEGGILWSPVGLHLPEAPLREGENECIATTRWDAMKMKARYLAGEKVEKTTFRAGYVNTEPFFDTAAVCAIDEKSKKYLKTFDIQSWYKRKRDNWELLRDVKKNGLKVLRCEDFGCYPFSLVLLFDSFDERDRVRKQLIEKQVYPAVLWNIPDASDGEAFKISRGMLSIHCDGRYTVDDIRQLATIIRESLI